MKHSSAGCVAAMDLDSSQSARFTGQLGCSRFFMVSALIVLCLGCAEEGPELGEVVGTITLDGQPLPDVRVEFQPHSVGSPSYGSSDNTGRYELRYSRERNGAMTGAHTVKMSTHNKNARKKEIVPPEYNERSQITREVIGGKTNVFDFAIDSAGEQQ